MTDTDAVARDAVDPDVSPAVAAARVRARGEAVRRRELATALDRLDADAELSAADRAAVARLSARLTDALVERWASAVADGRADPETALELFEP